MIFVFLLVPLAVIEVMVIVSAMAMCWRARKIANWLIPFSTAHAELWKVWGIACAFAGVAGVISSFSGLDKNKMVSTLYSVGGWVIAYLVLRSRLPKLAKAMSANVDGSQLKKIGNQVVVYPFFFLMALGMVVAIVVPQLMHR